MIDLNVLTGRHFDLPRGRQIIRLIDCDPITPTPRTYTVRENMSLKEIYETIGKRFTVNELSEMSRSDNSRAGKVARKWAARKLVKIVGKISNQKVYERLHDKYPPSKEEVYLAGIAKFLKGKKTVTRVDVIAYFGEGRSTYIMKNYEKNGLIKKTDQRDDNKAVIYEVTL